MNGSVVFFLLLCVFGWGWGWSDENGDEEMNWRQWGYGKTKDVISAFFAIVRAPIHNAAIGK
jgi:hypothetical protein